jgi:predicted metal-dependent HD superfamily phosphohydrolase
LVFENYEGHNRYYHNLEHIVHCLQEMVWLESNSKDTFDYEQLCAAILAHDIVHGAKDEISDEKLSAEILLKELGEEFIPAYDIVLSTQHFSGKKEFSSIEKVMRSIDLSILGKNWKLYKKYTENIRKEYSFVGESDYKKGRANVLKLFLEKEKIFESNNFSNYEQIARQNIKKELNKLMTI